MDDVTIRVEDLSKHYHIGASAANFRFTEVLQSAPKAVLRYFASFFKRPSVEAASKSAREHSTSFWALRDISFEVNRGEVLGILGRNGAGKSTLLKILARITKPTSGRFGVRGRIASLLEVGTGFHAELTGKENIFLSGALLGMSRNEVKRHFDEIVDFAEVDQFLDTPVKRYSSGMYVRLGFAIAAHLNPEILVIDEVLAVGDLAFQKKCLKKMDVVAGEGRTIIFVSHNTGAVGRLCNKVLWLEDARVKDHGDCTRILADYEELMSDEEAGPVICNESEHVKVSSAKLLTKDGHASKVCPVATGADIQFILENKSQSDMTATIQIVSQDGVVVLETSYGETESTIGKLPPGRHLVACTLPANLLNQGHFAANLWVIDDQFKTLFQSNSFLNFQVVDVGTRNVWYGTQSGVVCPILEWNVESDD